MSLKSMCVTMATKVSSESPWTSSISCNNELYQFLVKRLLFEWFVAWDQKWSFYVSTPFSLSLTSAPYAFHLSCRSPWIDPSLFETPKKNIWLRKLMTKTECVSQNRLRNCTFWLNSEFFQEYDLIAYFYFYPAFSSRGWLPQPKPVTWWGGLFKRNFFNVR